MPLIQPLSEATRRFAAAALMAVLFAANATFADEPDDLDLPEAPAAMYSDFREVVRDSKAKVFPAVVFIRCLRETHESGRRISQEVSGSGVIISESGEVLTNWHVIDRATEVRCLLYDGTPMDAEIIGSDKDTDLALVQLKFPDDVSSVPFAEIGDSDELTEGDFVMAMGAPWGLSRSVSIGIISCTSRYLPENSEYSLWLQTDAAISPGNSGGPLVNTAGEVIGINTRGIMAGGDMGFSVPSNTIAKLLSQFREHGEVQWSWTGLQLQPLRDFNRKIYFDGTEGVIVAGTDPDSPARRAGLEARDRILSVNGLPTNAVTEEDLPGIRQLLGMLPTDEPAAIVVERGGERRTVELTPREKGAVEGDELDCPRWDMTFKSINQFDNPTLHFYRNEGVFIYGIKRPGNAASSGFGRNDIVTAIDGKPVTTLEDVKAVHEETMEALGTRRPRIVFTILRNGQMRQIVLDYSRDHERR